MIFIPFIFKNRQNNRLFWAAIGIISAEWILFKLAYPFPDFFSDSYSYIEAAAQHLDINIWPIGYSKFLSAFHAITYSDTFLVTFQFFMLALAALYFFFTLLYFYPLSKNAKIILFLFLFCNPLFFYISNYITADGLFCAMTLIWITELMWVIQRPSPIRILPQAICIFLAYTMRYNAMYYPIISAVAFYLSRNQLWVKVTGSLFVFLLIIPFLNFSRNAGEKLTGKPIYSILSGWQLANNALYMYGEIKVDSTKLPSKECRELDSISRSFYKQVIPGFKDYLDDHVGNFFIQDWRAPLKVYMLARYKDPGVKSWGMVTPTFAQYGVYLIKTHPAAYARYFVLMNTKNYLVPPLEKLEIYNMGQGAVGADIQAWFHYKSQEISVISTNLQQNVLLLFPAIFLVFNLLFAGGVCFYTVRKKYKSKPPGFNNILILAVSFWVVNLGFSIFANIIALRYQFFPMIFIFGASILLYDRLEIKSP